MKLRNSFIILLAVAIVFSFASCNNDSVHEEILRHKVFFDANGGKLVDDEGSVVDTVEKYVIRFYEFGELPTPTRTGYKFTGWYTLASNGVEIKSDTLVKESIQDKLYAHWEQVVYTVTLDTNGGNELEPTSVVYLGQYGELPTPTKANSLFIGWKNELCELVTPNTVYQGFKVESGKVVYNEVKDQEPEAVREPKNHTLTAVWDDDYVLQFFDVDKTTRVISENNIYVTDGTTYVLPKGLKKAGYVFKGWALEGETDVRVAESVYVPTGLSGSDNIKKFTAVYDQKEVFVSLNALKGTVENAALTTKYKSTYTLGNSEYCAVREGYTFDGWFLSDLSTKINSQEDFDTLIETNTTGTIYLYAKYSPKTFTIKYDVNGGSADLSSKTDSVTYDSAFGVLPSPGTKKYQGTDNYCTFRGWELNGQIINETTIVKITSTMLDAKTNQADPDTVTLVASWIDN